MVNTAGMKLGIEVEQVNSILEVEEKNVAAMQEVICTEQNCFRDSATSNRELIMLLDADRLVPDRELETIQRIVGEKK